MAEIGFLVTQLNSSHLYTCDFRNWQAFHALLNFNGILYFSCSAELQWYTASIIFLHLCDQYLFSLSSEILLSHIMRKPVLRGLVCSQFTFGEILAGQQNDVQSADSDEPGHLLSLGVCSSQGAQVFLFVLSCSSSYPHTRSSSRLTGGSFMYAAVIIILLRWWITKMLIRLPPCAGWPASL